MLRGHSWWESTRWGIAVPERVHTSKHTKVRYRRLSTYLSTCFPSCFPDRYGLGFCKGSSRKSFPKKRLGNGPSEFILGLLRAVVGGIRSIVRSNPYSVQLKEIQWRTGARPGFSSLANSSGSSGGPTCTKRLPRLPELKAVFPNAQWSVSPPLWTNAHSARSFGDPLLVDQNAIAR